MRLTKKLKPPYEQVLGQDYVYTSETRLTPSFASVEQKLGQLEDIEEELGIDLLTLFNKKHGDSYDLNIERDDKTIYFCGDSYYGHWTQEEWLNFIKEIIAVYRELLKLGH